MKAKKENWSKITGAVKKMSHKLKKQGCNIDNGRKKKFRETKSQTKQNKQLLLRQQKKTFLHNKNFISVAKKKLFCVAKVLIA